jgi:chloramphenicol O-acetyltransferase type A
MAPVSRRAILIVIAKRAGLNRVQFGSMAHYLDLDTWVRRDTFNFFRDFDKPYFNVCTSLDVTNLRAFLKQRPDLSISLTYHYLALRIGNEIEPFRYRLREGKVLVHDVIHGGTTVLLPNESFIMAYFDYDEDFEKFMSAAMPAVAAARAAGEFGPRPADDAIHFTTLPWMSFTSFSHARNWGREDSVPKIAFGKFVTDGERVRMPISVEVHHALMDGLHVGRFLSRLEETFLDPESCLRLKR